MEHPDITLISPYHCLATSTRVPANSLYTSRPTNAFAGVRAAIRRRHWFLLLVSLVTVVAEFLPIFLSNIPYDMTQLYAVYVDAYIVSISILGAMFALVAASFFVRWTRLPADPGTLAGAMYFVVDSSLLMELAHRRGDMMDGPEEDKEYSERKGTGVILSRGVNIGFGAMKGMSGSVRTQVGVTGINSIV